MRSILYTLLFLIIVVSSAKFLLKGAITVRTADNSECGTVKSTSPYQADMQFCRSEFISEDAWQSKIDEFVTQREFSNHELYNHYTVSVIYSGERGNRNSALKDVEPIEPIGDKLPITDIVERRPHSQSTPIHQTIQNNSDSKESVNLFPDTGTPQLFYFEVDQFRGTAALVLHEDNTISGSITFSQGGSDTVHHAEGKLLSDKSISLTEYLSDGKEVEIECVLAPLGKCLRGRCKNMMNDDVSVSLCKE